MHQSIRLQGGRWDRATLFISCVKEEAPNQIIIDGWLYDVRTKPVLEYVADYVPGREIDASFEPVDPPGHQ